MLDPDKYELPKFEIHKYWQKLTKYCICVPVLNEGDKIKAHLKRMLPYSKLADIVIADGGSTDGSMNKKFLINNNVRSLLILKGPGKQGAQLRIRLVFSN